MSRSIVAMPKPKKLTPTEVNTRVSLIYLCVWEEHKGIPGDLQAHKASHDANARTRAIAAAKRCRAELEQTS